MLNVVMLCVVVTTDLFEKSSDIIQTILMQFWKLKVALQSVQTNIGVKLMA
jgi:hypothetical protein